MKNEKFEKQAYEGKHYDTKHTRIGASEVDDQQKKKRKKKAEMKGFL